MLATATCATTERALHESAAIFKQQIWHKDDAIGRLADECKLLKVGRCRLTPG